MGFIRGFLVVVLSVLILVSFLAMNVSLTFNLSLQYQNVREEVGNIVQDYVGEDLNLNSEINLRLNEINSYCEGNPETDFVFIKGENTFSVSCESASQGSEAMIRDATDSLIEDFYYKDYDCDFFACIKEGSPLVLVSENSKDYWRGKFILALFISIAFFVLILLLVEKKHNAFLISGSLLALSSLPFIKLGAFLSSIDSLVLVFFNILFSRSQDVFVIGIISGIVLFVIGILMKVFMVGVRISNWIDKIKMKNNLATEEEPIKKGLKNSEQKTSKKPKGKKK